jgi:hypothetical protein
MELCAEGGNSLLSRLALPFNWGNVKNTAPKINFVIRAKFLSLHTAPR